MLEFSLQYVNLAMKLTVLPVVCCRCVKEFSKIVIKNFSDRNKCVFLSLLDLLMWSQATESVTNTAVTLGADVNITCDLDIEEIYWYRQKSPDPPVLILRTYEGAKYENSIFKLKYSVKTNSRLFIRNISTDELGVYYCVKTSEPQKVSTGTKIYISGELFSYFDVKYCDLK